MQPDLIRASMNLRKHVIGRDRDRWLAMTRNDASRQMPLHLRPRLQRRTLLCHDLRDPLRREIHVDKAGRGIGDLVILRDQPSRSVMIATPSNMTRAPLASGSNSSDS